VSGQLHAPATLPPRKSPRYPFYRRLGEPQSRSGRYGEVKIFYPTGTRTPTPVGRPARSQSLYRLSYSGSFLFYCTQHMSEMQKGTDDIGNFTLFNLSKCECLLYNFTIQLHPQEEIRHSYYRHQSSMEETKYTVTH
jgi:hypothetical protein